MDDQVTIHLSRGEGPPHRSRDGFMLAVTELAVVIDNWSGYRKTVVPWSTIQAIDVHEKRLGDYPT